MGSDVDAWDVLPLEEWSESVWLARGAEDALVVAQGLARGAKRGASRRDAVSAVAAVAYHAARRQSVALQAVTAALRAARDARVTQETAALRHAAAAATARDEAASGDAAPYVSRAVLREALARGDVDASSRIVRDLERRAPLEGRERLLDLSLIHI